MHRPKWKKGPATGIPVVESEIGIIEKERLGIIRRGLGYVAQPRPVIKVLSRWSGPRGRMYLPRTSPRTVPSNY